VENYLKYKNKLNSKKQSYKKRRKLMLKTKLHRQSSSSQLKTIPCDLPNLAINCQIKNIKGWNYQLKNVEF